MKRETGDGSVRTRARHVENASHCEGNKGSKKGEGERAGRDGAAEILSLSAEKKYVPLRNGSKAPRVCFTTSYQSAKKRRGRWDTKQGRRAHVSRPSHVCFQARNTIHSINMNIRNWEKKV